MFAPLRLPVGLKRFWLGIILSVGMGAGCSYEESGVLTFGNCNLTVEEFITVEDVAGNVAYIHPNDEEDGATVPSGEVPFQYCRMRYRFSSESRAAYTSERTHVHTQLAIAITDGQVSQKKYGEKQDGFLNLYEFYGSPAGYDENHFVWRLDGVNYRLGERGKVELEDTGDPEKMDYTITLDQIPIDLDEMELDSLPMGWESDSAFVSGKVRIRGRAKLIDDDQYYPGGHDDGASDYEDI